MHLDACNDTQSGGGVLQKKSGGNDVETHETVDWAAILISVSQQLWHHTLNP